MSCRSWLATTGVLVNAIEFMKDIYPCICRELIISSVRYTAIFRISFPCRVSSSTKAVMSSLGDKTTLHIRNLAPGSMESWRKGLVSDSGE